MKEPIRFLRVPEVMRLRGRKRSSLYADIARGVCVPPIDLGGGRAVGFPEHEISALNDALLAGKSQDEIRNLVRQLVAARSSPARAG